MIDISEKPVIRREATAEGMIILRKSTMKRIEEGKIEKGNPIQIASVGAHPSSEVYSSLSNDVPSDSH